MRDLVGICHDRLSEAHGFGCGGLQAALQAAPSLAWSCTQYAISGGEGAATIGCSGGFAAAGVAARAGVAAGGGGISMACGSVGSLEYFL